MVPTFSISNLRGSQAVAGSIIKALMRKAVGVWGNYTRVWELRRASCKKRHPPGVPKHKEALVRLGWKESCSKKKKGLGWQVRNEIKLGCTRDWEDFGAFEQKAAPREADKWLPEPLLVSEALATEASHHLNRPVKPSLPEALLKALRMYNWIKAPFFH